MLTFKDMEIIKIFSEVDTEDRLYSVLLSEDEVLLFSEFQKEFVSKKTQKILEGMDDLQKKRYLEERKGQAEFLRKKRSMALEDFKDNLEDGKFNKFEAFDKRNKKYDQALKTSRNDLRGAIWSGNQDRAFREMVAEKSSQNSKGLASKGIGDWVKKNPGKTAAGTLAVAGTIYGAKKYLDSRKKNKE